ncbi:1274_t:CDS:2 [Acaulospora colombiana]|uniref:1274_t:CDS:1 n=1 Tax=Acaulospora colombiana TaxID=27376 RepID=A0ACA9KMS5_9GLOM|nr:1274_t:CDS:2 [Acaulospora colombiana]
MYLLLRNPTEIGVTPNGSSYLITDASDTDKNLYPNITISQTFDVSSVNDNYFSSFWKSTESVYFWLNGRWDQLEQWDYLPIDILSLTASLLLVTVMQNMLIAFMAGVFDDANSSGKDAVLQYRAELISDYETLEKPFGMDRGNPRWIYYVGRTDETADWLKKAEEYRSEHRTLLGVYQENVSEVVKERGIVESRGFENIEELQERVKGMEDKIERLLRLLEGRGRGG